MEARGQTSYTAPSRAHVGGYVRSPLKEPLTPWYPQEIEQAYAGSDPRQVAEQATRKGSSLAAAAVSRGEGVNFERVQFADNFPCGLRVAGREDVESLQEHRASHGLGFRV